MVHQLTEVALRASGVVAGEDGERRPLGHRWWVLTWRGVALDRRRCGSYPPRRAIICQRARREAQARDQQRAQREEAEVVGRAARRRRGRGGTEQVVVDDALDEVERSPAGEQQPEQRGRASGAPSLPRRHSSPTPARRDPGASVEEAVGERVGLQPGDGRRRGGRRCRQQVVPLQDLVQHDAVDEAAEPDAEQKPPRRAIGSLRIRRRTGIASMTHGCPPAATDPREPGVAGCYKVRECATLQEPSPQFADTARGRLSPLTVPRPLPGRDPAAMPDFDSLSRSRMTRRRRPARDLPCGRRQRCWSRRSSCAAGIGFGLGALVGWAVPLGIAGLFAGFAAGLALVIPALDDAPDPMAILRVIDLVLLAMALPVFLVARPADPRLGHRRRSSGPCGAASATSPTRSAAAARRSEARRRDRGRLDDRSRLAHGPAPGLSACSRRTRSASPPPCCASSCSPSASPPS